MGASGQRDSSLERLARFKRHEPPIPGAFGPELISFFKASVEKRQGKFSKIAACWSQLIPERLNAHCALESFSRGSLTVIVDSASHLYDLKQLLLAGLNEQMLIAGKTAGLKKIVLKPGRWYETPRDGGPAKIRFEQ